MTDGLTSRQTNIEASPGQRWIAALIAVLLPLAACSAEPAAADQRGEIGASAAETNSADTKEPAYPALTGRVTDMADILPPEVETALSKNLAAVEARTRHQFVIVTVPTLSGATVENYTRGLGNRWGIGRKDVNDGVILLVAPNERKIRIAVGNGLRHKIPDAEAGVIVEAAVESFRKGDFPGGVTAATKAVIGRMDKEGPAA